MVILKAHRFCRESLHAAVAEAHPTAAIESTDSIETAHRLLADRPCDLLVTGIVNVGGGVIEHLQEWTCPSGPVRHTIIVAEHVEPLVLFCLREHRMSIVVDESDEGLEGFARGLGLLGRGERYWSPALVDRVLRSCVAHDGALRLLSPTERMVLGVIGDGCDDATAAMHLPLSQQTIKTVRRQIHRRLSVQHRGELVACATELGFVLRTPYGVIRPGLEALLTRYQRPVVSNDRRHPAAA